MCDNAPTTRQALAHIRVRGSRCAISIRFESSSGNESATLRARRPTDVRPAAISRLVALLPARMCQEYALRKSPRPPGARRLRQFKSADAGSPSSRDAARRRCNCARSDFSCDSYATERIKGWWNAYSSRRRAIGRDRSVRTDQPIKNRIDAYSVEQVCVESRSDHSRAVQCPLCTRVEAVDARGDGRLQSCTNAHVRNVRSTHISAAVPVETLADTAIHARLRTTRCPSGARIKGGVYAPSPSVDEAKLDSMTLASNPGVVGIIPRAVRIARRRRRCGWMRTRLTASRQDTAAYFDEYASGRQHRWRVQRLPWPRNVRRMKLSPTSSPP